MSFAELQREDQRLVLLRALAEDTVYTVNESLLHDVMTIYGHNCSRDNVRTHLSWLQEQGLVTIQYVSGYMVATLTSRGLDVANGAAVVPGVKRPRPGA